MNDAMNRLALVVGCLLALPGPAAAMEDAQPEPSDRQAHPLTLGECYQLALKRSETIAIQQELLKATEGRFLQALSGALPTVSFVSSDRRQDGSGQSAFTLRDVPDRRLTLSQPLFGGFKEFAAMAASRAERRQRTEDTRRAEQLLWLDVSDAFERLAEHRQDLDVLDAIRAALDDRIAELAQRERLGRSRRSEVAGAESRRRRVEAERKRVSGLSLTSRQLLEFLTGLADIPAIAAEEQPVEPPEEDTLSLSAAANRPDVRAAEAAWEAAKKLTAVARADVFPNVDLNGNYYLERVGAAEDVTWDVALLVDVPLFQGGKAAGAIREATSRERQARLQADRTRREAELEIRQARAQWAAAHERHAALLKAQDAAEENYRLHLADDARHLISTLDVLDALQELQDVRRDVVASAYDARRLAWRLRVATGEIP
jgi:outer membrane protein